MIYAFGEFELDDGLYQLRRGSGVVKLEPKVFDVLAHLIRHRDRVVSKDELLETLWPGEFVSESVLPRCVTAARKALGDARREAAFIATIHGRGYRFLAEVAERPEPRGADSRRVEPPTRDLFVGRAAAMADLTQALEDALVGRGHLMLLAGEPGIGKTRIAEEIAAKAARGGVRVAVGRCYEGEGAPAFWPWVQVLRACMHQREAGRLRAELGPGAGDIAELVPELRERFPDLPRPAAIASPEARFRLFDSVAAYLKRTSTEQAVLVLLDDLHWADPSSLQVLEFVARDLRQSRLLVVGTYRDVELGRQHPLAQVLGELAREPACQRLVLRGLEQPEVRRFIEHAVDGTVSDALAAAVYHMTEGNPFFIGQIMRWLAAEGRLQANTDASGWNVILPQGVREAVGRRLNDLSEPCNHVLALAAVIGREFSVAALEELAGVNRETLLLLLDEAARARIVADASSGLGVFAFAHTLIRQTLYEEISAPRRVLLHARVGEVLESIHRNDLDPHLAELAHHFFQAAAGGNVDKAIVYAVRAAERAARLLAYEEAAEQYGRALQLWELRPASEEPAAGAQRCALLLGLGNAHAVAGNRERSQHACRQAADLARRLDRPDLLARAALGFGQRAELGPLPAEELRCLLDEALEALGGDEDALRARVLSRLAGTAPYQDSMEARATFSRQALELAKRSGDREALFDAFGARLWALMGPDDDSERLRCADELATFAERGGQKEPMLLVHEHRIRSFLSAGKMAAADREARAYDALARELRQPVYLLLNELYHVGRALGDGRFSDAEGHIERTVLLGQRLQYPGMDAIFLWQVFWLLRQKGRMAELATTLSAMSARIARGSSTSTAATLGEMASRPADFVERYPVGIAFQHAVAAYWQAETGQTADARRNFDAVAAGGFARLPRDEWWTATLTTSAEVCAILGDAPRAAELYACLEPVATKNATHQLVRTYSGAVSHFLGLLAGTQGEFETATGHFDLALEMNAGMGALPALARTQYEYATLLLRRGRSDDRLRSRDLLDQASRTATTLGMTGLHRQIVRARQRARRPANRPAR